MLFFLKYIFYSYLDYSFFWLTGRQNTDFFFLFSYRDYNFFWVTIVGPHIGAVLGAYIYQTFIGYHWPVATSDVASPMMEEVDVNPAKRPAPDKGLGGNQSDSVILSMYPISHGLTDAFRQSKGFRQGGLNVAFG